MKACNECASKLAVLPYEGEGYARCCLCKKHISGEKRPMFEVEETEAARELVEWVLSGAGKVVPCLRLSAAQARGRAKRWAYWGISPYVLRLSAKGLPALYPEGRAASDFRSHKKAAEAAAVEAVRDRRVLVAHSRGTLKWSEAAEIIRRYLEERFA